MTTVSNPKADIVGTERPVGDLEKRPSFDSDNDVYATKLGNDQDGADMYRLGKKQQLNVRIGIWPRELLQYSCSYAAAKLPLTIHPGPDMCSDGNMARHDHCLDFLAHQRRQSWHNMGIHRDMALFIDCRCFNGRDGQYGANVRRPVSLGGSTPRSAISLSFAQRSCRRYRNLRLLHVKDF